MSVLDRKLMVRAFGLALLTTVLVVTSCSSRSTPPGAVGATSAAATSAQADLGANSTTSTPATSSPGAQVVLGPDGLGPLKLGMTADQAAGSSVVSGLRTFPGPDNTSSCQGIYLKAVTNRDAQAVDGYVSVKYGVVAIWAPQGVRTPEGIGIGSTLSATQAAYPGLTAGQGGPVVAVPGNSTAYYQFAYDPGSNIVVRVSLVAMNQNCFN
jgi:hypothetical protein